MNDDAALRGAAYHEAGHVIVARKLGLQVAEIEIGDDGSGHAQISPADHLSRGDQIALCVAGIEAQELFKCRTHELAPAADYARVIALVDGLTEAESLEYRKARYARALEILKLHLADVERLARHLIEHRRADGSSPRHLARSKVNGPAALPRRRAENLHLATFRATSMPRKRKSTAPRGKRRSTTTD